MSRRTTAIASACAGGFLAFLDTTIVNTAFPDIAASFDDAGPSQLSWILDAYFIVMAALLVPAGGIADRIGRKRVFIAGLALFVPASLLCALAPGWEVLVAGRALQGAGAAVIVAVSLALVLPLYPLERRASAVAIWGATAALAAAVGPALGGLLVEAGDWRWVFAANLPLGALVFLGARTLDESRDEQAQGLPDMVGVVLVIVGLGLLALGILEGGEWGWTSPRIVAPFAVAVILLAIVGERCRSHPRPVIELELLRNRANVATLLLGMAFFSTILANIVFLTAVWGYSVLTAGLAVVPGAVATTIVAVPAGRLAERFGHRAVIVPGCLLYVLGMAVVRGAGDEPDFLGTWLPALMLNGAGLGLALPTLAAWALQDTAPEKLASASAVQAAFRQFGGVLGTAALFAAGAPVTLAAAEDAYLVSTVWALGAGIVAASRSLLPLGAVIVTGVLVFAAPAAADTNVVVDFETGPALNTPITTQYQASAFVSFSQADGYRPYRKAVGNNVVANIGADLCPLEAPDDCELPIGFTSGRLTRTAKAVKLSAGLFEAAGAPVTAQLVAYRADGSVAATGTPRALTTTFTTEVSVTSAAADIARFAVQMDGNGAIGARHGFDNLTFTYPDNALPDLSLSVRPGEATVVQGGFTDIPITVTRLNGSNGAFTLAASGLPQGVTAQFVNSTLRLRAAADAPRVLIPRDITITATPSSGDVAPTPRSTRLPLRVASNFELVGSGTASFAPCAGAELALRVERDRTFNGTVTLTVKGLPAGVTATPEPAVIPPGGGFHVDVKIRLSADKPFVAAPFTVEAGGKVATYGVEPAEPTASLRTSESRLIAPSFLSEGSNGVLDGSGFCDGTRVRVGNDLAEAAATVHDGGRTLRFKTPRLATPGPITILPPHGATYKTTDLEVDTFRSNRGLSFANYDYAGFSFEEAVDTFGAEELFQRINLCWPLKCIVRTPIPDVKALAVVQIIDWAMQSSAGHCFGIARAVQGWAHNPSSLRRFTTGNAFSLTKNGSVSGYLDGQHATQASSQFLDAWFRRSKDLRTQLERIRSELSARRLPMVSVMEDGSGHAVLAYDIIDQPDGSAHVLVHDSNVPFDGNELGVNGLVHQDRTLRQSVIRISADRSSWELDMGGDTWRGGDKTLFAFGRGVIGEDPALPDLTGLTSTLTLMLFGSADGAVVTEAAEEDYMPVLDAAAVPRSGGVVAGSTHTVRGVKAGRYRQAVLRRGTLATVEAPTAVGVEDRVRAISGGLAFEGSGPARAITLDVTSAGASATIAAKASDVSARLDGSRLVFANDGAATTLSYKLRTTSKGAPSTFESGPVKVAAGDTVTASPDGRLRVRDKGGKVRTRTLTNRVRAPKVKIVSARVRSGKATVTVRVSGLSGQASGGLVLRAGKARKVIPIERAANGTQTFTWGGLTRKAKKVAARMLLVADGTTVRATK